MTLPLQQLSLGVRDVNMVQGMTQLRVTRGTLLNNPFLLDFILNWQAASNGEPMYAFLANSNVDDPGTAGADATYKTVSTLGILEFQLSDGSILRWTVPAAKEALFNAGQLVVDETGPMGNALITATLAAPLRGSTGQTIVEYVRGWRGWVPLQPP